jgi:type VI protein secretion system component Hcp
MSTARVLRAAAALATLAGAVLLAPPAEAAQFAIDVHVDGVAGGGNYAPKSFAWGEPFEVTFTHPTDASSVALMGLAREKRDIGNAVLHTTTSGVAVITLQMSGVHVESVREGDSSSAPDSTPEETVVLRFRRVTYTFQPVNAVGQRNGPPVSFTWGEGPR